MTGRPKGDALKQSTFFRTAADLADLHQLRCSVRLSPRAADRPYAQTNPLTRRIVISRAALAESDSEQAWSAAHEVGHLVVARDRGLMRFVPWRFCGWLLIGGAAAGVGPWAVITALDPVLPATGAVRLGVGLASLILGAALLAGCLHPALLGLAAHQRPLEDAADAFAKAQGYPVTRDIAEMLHRNEQRPDGKPQSLRRRRYRHHRDPFDRINDT